MATQLSAITLVGTTGQGYNDGLRFMQFYFGLPIAMIILSVTLVPFFYRARVYTAYEYLERRFDLKTRTFTSLLFLVSRGMSCGADRRGAGGRAVGHSRLGRHADGAGNLRARRHLHDARRRPGRDLDRRQGDGLTVFVARHCHGRCLVMELPSGVSVGDALPLAGADGRLNAFDFKFSSDGDLHDLVRPASAASS